MHRQMQPAVYILASQRHGTLYVGVTSDLIRRVWCHREDAVEGFSQRYQTHRLVYVEQHATMEAAISREKQLKKWNRAWKVRLIEEGNPAWQDLWPFVTGEGAELPSGKTADGAATQPVDSFEPSCSRPAWGPPGFPPSRE